MMLPREEVTWMLYRACCLYVEACGLDAPTWVHIIAGANLAYLEDAIEIAREDETYTSGDAEDHFFPW
ncbi:hypothetical protein [Thermanaerothrix sp.]|uniref:hypothetical protein n=1 Tax=Thermanaerothrix sp. TaxID=2972675 RepID=UPI002ADDCC8E|nr:hypothetical protein [Thermanaerothrix sp.]